MTHERFDRAFRESSTRWSRQGTGTIPGSPSECRTSLVVTPGLARRSQDGDGSMEITWKIVPLPRVIGDEPLLKQATRESPQQSVKYSALA